MFPKFFWNSSLGLCLTVDFQISFMPPIPVLIIIGIVLLLLCFMLCQEGGRLLKESEYSGSFINILYQSFSSDHVSRQNY